MAGKYIGQYTFPYGGGLFSIPTFSFDTTGEKIDAGRIREGSLYAIVGKDDKVLHTMGEVEIFDDVVLKSNDSLSPTTYGFFRGSTKLAELGWGPSNTPKVSPGLGYAAMGIDGNGDIYFYGTPIYGNNVPSAYSLEYSVPETGRAGYYISIASETRDNFDVTFYSSDKVTDTVLSNWLKKNIAPIGGGKDPYEDGGNSDIGGGTGDFDGESDAIDFPPLPTLSAVDTGFITLFNPSLSEMKNLASYMWSDLFDITSWKKLFADPMDAILGLSIVPVAVPDGGKKTVTVGNASTGISMNVAQSQFVEVDCGTLNVNEYWGAYLDYSPYTEAELYLPYIGIHAIKTDDIMGKPVHIKYHIDILSGACCAYVKCGNSVLYEFVGQGSCSIPITGNDWTNVINGALTIGASIGTMMATGGATAPMISSAASAAVNSLKPTVERSGSVSGMGGMLGIQKPYLVLTRPRQALPKNQNLYMGYPSFITSKLGDLSGYTEVEAVHLENIPATEAEIVEIENLLKDGVIF